MHAQMPSGQGNDHACFQQAPGSPGDQPTGAADGGAAEAVLMAEDHPLLLDLFPWSLHSFRTLVSGC
jgi:hypothetical protein